MPRLISSVFLAAGLFSVNGGASTHHEVTKNPGHSSETKQPNFVFIMTDDQDLHLDSLNYMPKLQRHIGNEGTVFERHFCTIAVCCPSRVSLMTGRLAHNTNVTDVNPPYGMKVNFSWKCCISNSIKADTLNLCQKVIMMTTCPFGCKMQAITPIIRESS